MATTTETARPEMAQATTQQQEASKHLAPAQHPMPHMRNGMNTMPPHMNHPPPQFTPNGYNMGSMPHSPYPIYPSPMADRGFKRKHEGYTPSPRVLPYVGRNPRQQQVVSADKNSKGLRHFSLRVCQKVKQKGITSYVEVAEELVQELTALEASPRARKGEPPGDCKNIRRRVYDALNVLMAMNIIAKERKEIKWVGLPSTFAQECMHLQEEKRMREERIRKKRAHLYELIIQQVAFKNLTARNMKNEAKSGGRPEASKCVELPYIIVNTNADTQIDCEMADDGTEYFFEFSQPFEIHDEIEVLKRMHLADGLDTPNPSPENVAHACTLVPTQIVPHIQEMARRANRPPPPPEPVGMPPPGPPLQWQQQHFPPAGYPHPMAHLQAPYPHYAPPPPPPLQHAQPLAAIPQQPATGNTQPANGKQVQAPPANMAGMAPGASKTSSDEENAYWNQNAISGQQQMETAEST